MKPPAEPVPKMVVAGTVIQGAKGKASRCITGLTCGADLMNAGLNYGLSHHKGVSKRMAGVFPPADLIASGFRSSSLFS